MAAHCFSVDRGVVNTPNVLLDSFFIEVLQQRATQQRKAFRHRAFISLATDGIFLIPGMFSASPVPEGN